MKLWKNLSNRLDAVADVMAAKPCMQGCVGKTLLSIPRTPGNLITAVILAIGLLITIGRFGFGLGAVTNLDDNNPWGIWIAFDLLCGVALAAGGYVTSSACYLFGMKRYHSAVRPAILTAFLGYAFVVVALLYDVGQPWRLPYPLLVSQGTTSLLFEVGPVRGHLPDRAVHRMVPRGPRMAPRHEGRPLLARPPASPNAYHPQGRAVLHHPADHPRRGAVHDAPVLAGRAVPHRPEQDAPPVVLAVHAGVLLHLLDGGRSSMVIFEGTLSHKALHNKMDETHLREADGVVFGFGRAASFVLIGYFIIKVLGHHHGQRLGTISLPVTVRGSPSKMVGFVLLPAFLYALGVREKNITLIRVASVFGVLGIVVNRFNVCLVAFNWQLDSADRYFPSISEVFLSIFIVTLIVTAYRFVCSKMPVLYEHPDFQGRPLWAPGSETWKISPRSTRL